MNNQPTGVEPSQVVRRRTTIIVAVSAGLVLAVIVALFAGIIGAPHSNSSEAVVARTSTPTPAQGSRPQPAQKLPPIPLPGFNSSAHSIDSPESIWVVSNKQRPLNPTDYEPTDLVEVPVSHTWTPLLRREAADAVVALFVAARKEEGLELSSNSAYRSYSAQVDVYNEDVATNGKAFADTSTARPGYSEHQTGLAIDIGARSGDCSLKTCFEDTDEGEWLEDNAWRFGFVLRYPEDKSHITGFDFEPWHFRYVGVDLATEMHRLDVETLEEFFNLPAAPRY
jgi:D-alanyl-D-alanine carboxypeptidase